MYGFLEAKGIFGALANAIIHLPIPIIITFVFSKKNYNYLCMFLRIPIVIGVIAYKVGLEWLNNST